MTSRNFDVLAPHKPEERLIFALDVPEKREALNYVRQLKDLVTFYKVGWELFLAEGLGIVRYLKDQGFQVFLDLKIQDDVDETISRYIQVAIREKVDFVTLHGSPRLFSTAKRAKGDAQLTILSLTLLSNMDEAAMRDNYLLENGTQFSLKCQSPEDYVRFKTQTTLEAGCDGLIASGRFVEMLRKEFKDRDPIIVTPGVRPSGSSHAEHKNVLTPRQAIQAGANYLVVGRPIRDAESPLQMATTIVQEVSQALESLASS